MQIDPQKVRNRRELLCMTQEELMQKAGVGLRTIQRIEAGIAVSKASVRDIAQALQVAPEDLRLVATEAKSETSAENRYEFLPLAERDGHWLVHALRDAMLLDAQFAPTEDEDLGDLLAELEDTLSGGLNLAGELSASQRRAMGRDINALLEQTQSYGYALLAGLKPLRFAGVDTTIVLVRITPSEEPMKGILWDAQMPHRIQPAIV